MVISQNTESECPNSKDSTAVECSSAFLSLSHADARRIHIQFGVVSRLVKEHAFYLQESGSLLAKIDEMRSNDACVHDIKQMSEVYADSRKILTQVCVQLRLGRDLLFSLLEESNIDVLDPACPKSTCELILKARKSVVDANLILQDSPIARDLSESSDSDSDY